MPEPRPGRPTAAAGFTVEQPVRDQSKGRSQSMPRMAGFRNGLPVSPPYAYRGTGVDIYNGVTGSLEDVRRLRYSPSPGSGSAT